MKRKATISDVAKLANTSITTVSFYCNNKIDKMSIETQQRIEEAIDITGYVPNIAARTLHKGKSSIIGVIVGDITNGFSNRLVSGIDKAATKLDFQIMLGSSHYDSKREFQYVENMIKSNVDGFIIQPTMNFSESLKIIKKYKKPLVFVDSDIIEESVSSIRTDNYNATRKMTKYLIEAGYDNFVIVGADPSKILTRIERFSGYKEILEENGFKVNEIIIEENHKQVDMDFISEQLSKLIRLDKRTAIFVPNCWLLSKVYVEMKKYNSLIPDKVGLFGFDNDEWATVTNPSVSSINQPAEEEGITAINLLYSIIDKDSSLIEKRILNCQIDIKDSIIMNKDLLYNL